MNRVVYRPRAQADLGVIWDYSAEHWGVGQANTYVDQIRMTLVDVASGQKHAQSAEDVREGYRKIRVGRHVIYFRQTPDLIEVVRVLHERMDVGNL
jgi:toxin ParE1/3/4